MVQTGRLTAWRARQVAAVTPGLSRAAVGFVDRQVAVLGARGRVPGPGRLRGLVHEALCRFDPQTATEVEDTALLERDVTFDHTESTATTRVTATMDTMDALDLDATISDLCAQMARLGDTDPRGVRRSHALGLLAHPDRVLTLFPDPDNHNQSSTVSGPGSGPGRSVTLYAHVTTADLATADLTGQGGAGRVEKLGATTLRLLRDWLDRSDRVTIRPVLDPTGPDPDCGLDAVDVHDPPAAMRESVILRDGHCVFPGCTLDARDCDLDHIVAYLPLDRGGPPGQTRPQDLACLCRAHHRLKTFTAWTYTPTRAPTDTSGTNPHDQRAYSWTSPHGHTYLTHPTPKR